VIWLPFAAGHGRTAEQRGFLRQLRAEYTGGPTPVSQAQVSIFQVGPANPATGGATYSAHIADVRRGKTSHQRGIGRLVPDQEVLGRNRPPKS
jgi:hypothetical protein